MSTVRDSVLWWWGALSTYLLASSQPGQWLVSRPWSLNLPTYIYTYPPTYLHITFPPHYLWYIPVCFITIWPVSQPLPPTYLPITCLHTYIPSDLPNTYLLHTYLLASGFNLASIQTPGPKHTFTLYIVCVCLPLFCPTVFCPTL